MEGAMDEEKAEICWRYRQHEYGDCGSKDPWNAYEGGCRDNRTNVVGLGDVLDGLHGTLDGCGVGFGRSEGASLRLQSSELAKRTKCGHARVDDERVEPTPR